MMNRTRARTSLLLEVVVVAAAQEEEEEGQPYLNTKQR